MTPETAVAPRMPSQDPGCPGVAAAPPSPDPRLPQVYRCAAHLIWEHGWHQGADILIGGDRPGAICARYAIVTAAEQVAPDRTSARDLGGHALDWFADRMLNDESVSAWNDRRRSTAEQVLDTLDRAADLAEGAAQ